MRPTFHDHKLVNISGPSFLLTITHGHARTCDMYCKYMSTFFTQNSHGGRTNIILGRQETNFVFFFLLKDADIEAFLGGRQANVHKHDDKVEDRRNQHKTMPDPMIHRHLSQQIDIINILSHIYICRYQFFGLYVYLHSLDEKDHADGIEEAAESEKTKRFRRETDVQGFHHKDGQPAHEQRKPERSR